MTNEYRVQKGLPPLTMNAQLSLAAGLHASDIDKYQYWAHNNPQTGMQWNKWIDGSGYQGKWEGENLAADYNDATSTMNGWKMSKEHNDNLLNPNYTQMGVTVVNGHKDGKPVYYVVQTFGGPDNQTYSPSMAVVPHASTTPAVANPIAKPMKTPAQVKTLGKPIPPKKAALFSILDNPGASPIPAPLPKPSMNMALTTPKMAMLKNMVQ